MKAYDKIESNQQLYFRVESEEYIHRTPSLYINESLSKQGSEYYYRTLLNELGRVDYQESSSLVRLISELQHYGAKTRMLDITKSVLVALFFAVEETDRKKPGYIYIFKEEIGKEKFDTGHTVAIKSALNFMPQKVVSDFLDISSKVVEEGLNIETYGKYTDEELFIRLVDILEPQTFDSYKDICKQFMELLNQRAKVRERLMYPLKIYNDLNRAHIILPAKSTERIRQQQGTFIFPKYVSTTTNSHEEIKKQVSNSIHELQTNLKSNKHEFSVIKIPAGYKKTIRKELAQIGITPGFVYPDIEHQSASLISKLE
ncbi:conserved protein of unknown function [Brochothrix thermosphacta]|uniref:FRG domain-containing protein n=1 Tax=Brochothrix thermosphacta TaxID=2756 RepID=UPI000D7786A8|nr:FRG domain-containing protein [Brochothrix thermosphacta]SPN73061.1 conserved protein of unknown function [Brochothrix thermosphacta]